MGAALVRWAPIRAYGAHPFLKHGWTAIGWSGRQQENPMFGKLKERLSGGAKKLQGKTDLLEGICAMTALVAAADGEIEDAEVGAIFDALTTHALLGEAFSSSEIERVLDAQLKRAKGGMAGKLALKREIEEMKAKNPSDELEMALMISIDVAASDGEIEPEEKPVLEDLAKRLGFSLSSYL